MTFVTHRFSHEILPAIRSALDLIIAPTLNDETAKFITSRTSLGISLSARAARRASSRRGALRRVGGLHVRYSSEFESEGSNRVSSQGTSIREMAVRFE